MAVHEAGIEPSLPGGRQEVLAGINADNLRARWPGLRVLFMSGYTDDALSRHGVLNPGVVLLEKPFTPKRLAARIREVLAEVPEE